MPTYIFSLIVSLTSIALSAHADTHPRSSYSDPHSRFFVCEKGLEIGKPVYELGGKAVEKGSYFYLQENQIQPGRAGFRSYPRHHGIVVSLTHSTLTYRRITRGGMLSTDYERIDLSKISPDSVRVGPAIKEGKSYTFKYTHTGRGGSRYSFEYPVTVTRVTRDKIYGFHGVHQSEFERRRIIFTYEN